MMRSSKDRPRGKFSRAMKYLPEVLVPKTYKASPSKIPELTDLQLFEEIDDQPLTGIQKWWNRNKEEDYGHRAYVDPRARHRAQRKGMVDVETSSRSSPSNLPFVTTFSDDSDSDFSHMSKHTNEREYNPKLEPALPDLNSSPADIIYKKERSKSVDSGTLPSVHNAMMMSSPSHPSAPRRLVMITPERARRPSKSERVPNPKRHFGNFKDKPKTSHTRTPPSDAHQKQRPSKVAVPDVDETRFKSKSLHPPPRVPSWEDEQLLGGTRIKSKSMHSTNVDHLDSSDSEQPHRSREPRGVSRSMHSSAADSILKKKETHFASRQAAGSKSTKPARLSLDPNSGSLKGFAGSQSMKPRRHSFDPSQGDAHHLDKDGKGLPKINQHIDHSLEARKVSKDVRNFKKYYDHLMHLTFNGNHTVSMAILEKDMYSSLECESKLHLLKTLRKNIQDEDNITFQDFLTIYYPDLPKYQIEKMAEQACLVDKKDDAKDEGPPSDEILNDLNDLWEVWDKDGSGELNKYEFQEAMKGLGIFEQEDFDQMFSEIDSSNNNTIDKAEFMAWWVYGDSNERDLFR